MQAQVVNITPSDAHASRVRKDGSTSQVGANDVLCDGDTLVVEAPVIEIELKEGAHDTKYAPPTRKPYRLPPHPWLDRARDLVDTAVRGLGILRAPPSRPVPTAPRGSGKTEALQVARFLEPGTLQSVTTDIAPVIGWSGGTTPYRCAGVKVPSGQTWCKVPVTQSSGSTLGTELLLESADRQGARWTLERVAWPKVPRPDWIQSAVLPDDDISETAWALWLWREAGPKWRLQALGMLESASRDNWLAETLLDEALLSELDAHSAGRR